MSAKDEAIRSIDHVHKMLDGPLDALGAKLAKATLEHARENVEAIQELKHKRRAKVATA